MCRTLAEKADTARAHAEPHVKVRPACQLGCKGCIRFLLTGVWDTAIVCYVSTPALTWRGATLKCGTTQSQPGSPVKQIPQ